MKTMYRHTIVIWTDTPDEEHDLAKIIELIPESEAYVGSWDTQSFDNPTQDPEQGPFGGKDVVEWFEWLREDERGE